MTTTSHPPQCQELKKLGLSFLFRTNTELILLVLLDFHVELLLFNDFLLSF